MIRRLAFIGVFTAVFAVLIFGATSYALGRTQPNPDDMNDNGQTIHILRAHKSGSVTSLTLAAYYEGRNGNTTAPANKTLTILKTGRVCKDSGGGGDTIGLRIRVGVSSPVYEQRGNCNNIFKNYTIKSGDFTNDVSKTGKWRAEINFQLYDFKTKNGKIDDNKYDHNKNQHRTYYFRAQVSSGGILSSPENGSRTGYGIVGNGSDGSVSYNFPFARPLNECNAGSASERVGMWDPDSNTYGTTKIRLREQPRGGGTWSNTRVSEHDSGSNVTISSAGDGWYNVNGKTGTSAWLNFNASPDKEYRFQIRNSKGNARGNVYSFFWPYDTIGSTTSCNYNLNPKTTINPLQDFPGAPITVTRTIANSMDAPSDTTVWDFYKFKLTPGAAVPPKGDGTAACTRYGSNSAVSDCTRLDGGSRVFPGNRPINLGNHSDTIPAGDPSGTKYCYVLSVQKPTSSSSSSVYRLSAPVCTSVLNPNSINPSVNVLGGDVRTRGGISTSLTKKSLGGSDYYFGSWVKHGALSVGDNAFFASGAGLSVGSTSPAQSSWSGLTFANTALPDDPSEMYGQLESALQSPDIAGHFEKRVETARTNGSLIADCDVVQGIHECSNGATIGASTSVEGTVVLYSAGTVTIDGNIEYKADSTPLSKLPQVIIIAKEIIINSGVTNVDAWLITTDEGTVRTCENGPPTAGARLSTADCALRLTVNGPVVTDALYLNRTAGSRGTTIESLSEPAETFNLRPDAYLWAYYSATSRTIPVTASIKELPPRF